MGLNTSAILTTNLALVKRVITFFTSQVTNPELFEEIKMVCIKDSKKRKKLNAEKFLNDGQLSIYDFLTFQKEKNEIKDDDAIAIVEMTVKELVETNLLWPLSEVLQFQSQDLRYKCPEGERNRYLYKNALILNLVCGWQFLIDKYRDSIFKIEHTSLENTVSIGTGFYIKWQHKKVIKEIVVTNKHVLENASKISVLDRNDNIMAHSELIIDPLRDLGFIELKESPKCPSLLLGITNDVLAEVLTIGYPSVPTTKYAYQLYHKGEINSFIEDFWGNKLFLFSAKTSSGNSGSPVLDRYGLVVGIVSSELFDPDLFADKGKLPYYAAIPSHEIDISGNENVFKGR